MSRLCTILFAAAAFAPLPVLAQATEPGTSGEANRAEQDRALAADILTTRERASMTPRQRCVQQGRPGEIVVCGQDDDQHRLPSLGDDSGDALTTPDIGGRGIFQGKSTMSGMCLLPPCPPEAPYLVDLPSLPKPPAGSDADLIARGLKRAD